MRCAFGYTIVDPVRERRVKYFDENGIHDEPVQNDKELITLGEKLRNGGYRYFEDLGKAEKAMFEIELSDLQYEEVLEKLNRIREKYDITHWDEKERVV